jgi:hypothetical protein
MKTMIFVAVEAQPIDRFELGEEAVVADLLSALEQRGVEIAELLIFKEDHDEPLEPHDRLHSHEHPVFHAHRCRKIEVTVNYKTETFRHGFPPSATIAKVTEWAVRQAGLGMEEAEEHVLQVHGSRLQPPPNVHVGSLVVQGCAVAFDLVRKKLVQG